MDSEKLNVLVLPDLFPENEKDWVGIFVVDYIKSILPKSNPWIFYSRLKGNHLTVKQEVFNGDFDVFRWSYKSSISKLLKPFYYLLWFNKTVNQIIALKKDIDIIHSHGAILNGTVAYLLAKKLNVPFVISEHTGPFSKISNSFIKRIWAKFILHKANKVFAVSNHLKKDMVEMGVKPEKVEVSYNPVDPNLFKIKEGNLQLKNVLFVSRLESFKGGLRTVKAFHEFIKQNKDWQLTICGDGPEKGLIIEYVNEFKLDAKITVKGALTKPEYVEELHKATFLVFPSLHESFGLIPVEAMTCGLPVITTNATAMPEYINKDNGVLLPNSTITEIAEAMNYMAENQLKYKTNIISNEMVQRFGIDNFGTMLMDNYKSVIKQHNS